MDESGIEATQALAFDDDYEDNVDDANDGPVRIRKFTEQMLTL